MSQKVDVCIIGAGAAGLAAANALDPRLRVCLIDKNEIPGRKILAAGGGRCNLTNADCSRHRETLDFFRGLGLETTVDAEGRYYPYSECASDVAEALLTGLSGRDVRWILSAEVTAVSAEGAKATPAREAGAGAVPDTANRAVKNSAGAGAAINAVKDGEHPGFRITWKRVSGRKTARAGDPAGSEGIGAFPEPDGNDRHASGGTVTADRVILCTGGKAAPSFGTTGDGYRLARALGHPVSRVYPILTGINCPLPEELAGIRARGRVRLLEEGSCVAEEIGQIQFTTEGLSGICVFDLTPRIQLREGEGPKEGFARYQLEVDLAPDFTAEELGKRETSFGIVTRRLARTLSPARLKCWRLPVQGVWGWEKAQCTAGGVELSRIDPETMESRLWPGLFFAGELLDLQGPCGGYNLQNAWETGIRAARAASRQAADTADDMDSRREKEAGAKTPGAADRRPPER